MSNIPISKNCNHLYFLTTVGTIITAFFMGPLIELFNVHVARPLLKKL